MLEPHLNSNSVQKKFRQLSNGQVGLQCGSNRPFPSSYVPPLQSECKCEVFLMRISFTKCGKMYTREPRLVLISLLIGWKSGAKTLIQSLSEVMQNQSNSLITFDTQLKTALCKVELIAIPETSHLDSLWREGTHELGPRANSNLGLNWVQHLS